MRVLITGGAGFIGRHLAGLLVSHGHEVVALDMLHPQVHLDPSLAISAFPGKVISGDVSEPAAWHGLPAVDALVHLAAETGVGQSMYEVERYRSVNVGGTRAAAQFAAACGIPLVSLSSRAVYGEGRYECPGHGVIFGSRCCAQAVPAPSAEDDPLRPTSVYGKTKAEAEAVAATVLADEGQLTIIRPQNVIGPGQALHNPYTGVLAAFLAMLREGKALTVYGSGQQTRDFVHVSDLARQIAWQLETPPAPGRIRVVNSGTGVRSTLLDLARAAIDAAPTGSVDIVHRDVQRAGDIEHACADLARCTALGVPLPSIGLRQSVFDFIGASWTHPGAPASAWDDALRELGDRGLTS